MNKSNGALLRDIRIMKRTTGLFQSPQDILNSIKQIKKTKSTKQININSLMENKNEKIRNIDQKLEIHESEIQKNNRIIQDLRDEFVQIKEQLILQKEKASSEEKKSKLLKEEIERTGKLLKAKSIKVEELLKTKEHLQKQIQSFKPITLKNDEYTRTIATLRKQISFLQETISSTKHKLDQKDKQFMKAKQSTPEIDKIKSQLNILTQEISAKDAIINNYKLLINDYSQQKDQELLKKIGFEKEVQRLCLQLDELKKSKLSVERQYAVSEKKLSQTQKKLELLQTQREQINEKAKNHESEENTARKQLQELKIKNQDLIAQFNQKVTQCNIQSTKAQKAHLKIKQLEAKVAQYKNQKEKLLKIQEKFSEFKLKSKNLQKLYTGMLPQIQCPFGHELKEPVTIIPCGHNYCLTCKKGYQKECCQCKSKIKIEAVYRNELMDDIIGIINSIRQVMQLVK